ncbi:MAG: precorrin-4 C(11)-methyltransferase [Nitrospinae bacterium RIFCSPLOWO2_02_39_17]|nr:MAG: precorrin-4 C(11)-methyltransferase [Nitrospinae bacterium RIFCSPHIGHO2_02_39_11]OGV98704.1 MAG: precorrin-4 C(11)-methyltransferase [Nitrospinae bacterium RIFCSPHIGHO2_12_FULL_39_42]OGW02716.1 MAG: precorrin-4 C(11)-methyltransferase [Nitrospinae bacterium RIFCSPHIGHO2_02_FULL_39_82]OGW07308.1 MAG: precorrin-4 C(11)-methyltransferase [Nitrospinae bacterium RIFCSPLOWO2_02_39_17]OGW11292.1 MAG: precorrin-4 C(11)-methyltransferase [Nitrospinae bacterium RIFCSPLOWO2_12_39_15]OHB91313.1 MA
MKVYFIGAGPGDPKLITIKGKEVIEKADIVIYAGSLVNEDILKYAVNAKEIHDSATLNLKEIGNIFRKAKEGNFDVARIHSGDPSIYGAINEQMRLLDDMGIPYEVIPGISSFQAAAAALCQELTLPGVCQTITITRVAGNTPVPEKENLKEIIKTRPTLILFLSVSKLGEIVETLKTGYPPSTPVAIVYRVSLPEEEIILGTLMDIMERIEGIDIKRTALIIVGEVLSKNGGASFLYDKDFEHTYRTKT